jgi:hypothetical protein
MDWGFHGSQNCGRPFDGVLGVSALKLSQIAFDFEHDMFSWRKY